MTIHTLNQQRHNRIIKRFRAKAFDKMMMNHVARLQSENPGSIVNVWMESGKIMSEVIER